MTLFINQTSDHYEICLTGQLITLATNPVKVTNQPGHSKYQIFVTQMEEVKKVAIKRVQKCLKMAQLINQRSECYEICFTGQLIIVATTLVRVANKLVNQKQLIFVTKTVGMKKRRKKVHGKVKVGQKHKNTLVH